MITPTMMLVIALSVLIGVSLGMLGSGGAILTLPLLVYVAAIEPHDAVAMSLLIVAVTSGLGAALHARHGHFHLRSVLFLGSSGLFGSIIGAQFTRLLPPAALLTAFALVMLVVGASMFRRPLIPCATPCVPPRCLTIGFAVGLLTGFLGVGGGFLIMPALVLLAGVEVKKALGASLAIIALNSTAGFVGHLRDVHMHWELTGAVLAAALVGMWIGEYISDHVDPQVIRRVFAVFVLAVGAVLLAVNLPALFRLA